ncbi:hypothetical protein RJT34_03694 [Clitoria ternatea]|uniref:Beta-1,3-N-Acetylglucosaminyltransferase family protein n=1 Tax=Clitoria ternatea TaxID=43366 RepID=A0AAN9KJG9_CLITE
MGDSTCKILCASIFLVLISQGYSQCSLKDLSVTQQRTGAKVEGKPEFSVTITNKCACVQTNVKLTCHDFKTVEAIDSSKFLAISEDSCLVNGGQPIYRDPISFKYAWDQPYQLNPISSQIACS